VNRPVSAADQHKVASRPARSPARLVLVGVRGYGQVHAERIARLAEKGAVQLVAAVDPVFAADSPTSYGVDLHADLADALAELGHVDVVVIAAPIGEHARLAEVAMRFGADVLLEKPPVASLDDFHRLLAVEQETGCVVQVGFQSLGSDGPERFADDAFGIGRIARVSAVGSWSRTVGYWSRSPWAGHRSLRGRPVLDGVVTNSLAHAVVTALACAGCRRIDDVASVEVDLYRANAIDSDDTSVVRIRTSQGIRVTCALSLCAPKRREPVVHIEGADGLATFTYTEDRVEVTRTDESRTETLERTDLLENLLASRRDGSPLLVPLVSTGAFMSVLDAIAWAEEPVRIDPRAIRWDGAGLDRRPVVDDIEHWLEAAASTGQTFSELGVPWAHPGRDYALVRVRLTGTEVAVYTDGRGTIPTSSPRPVLHPVRTLAGVVVTARHPADHDWHNGAGMAIPNVNGTNFWGGRTYIHGQGYVLLDNHGQIVGDPPELRGDAFTQRLRWIDRTGSVQLREVRSVAWSAIDSNTWRLTFESSLRSDTGATLASPGSKGREDGGYGGFFWRFPACDDVEVMTASARGEVEVQHSLAPWVGWRADFAAGPGISGPATLVVAAPDAAVAGEPWFVRVREYPGLGSALAWDRPASIPPGAVLRRRFDVAVADGRLTDQQVADLGDALVAVRSSGRVR
jgi:predicted dehydrogenase